MRKCIIMSGPSGSGKSTWINKQPWAPNAFVKPPWTSPAFVCSADYFFGMGADYKFDATKLSEAHGWCLRGFIDACQGFAGDCFAGDRDNDIIVVDNTNTTIEEIAPYYSIAKAYGYEVELITIDVPPHIAAGRNLHGVPLPSVRAMFDRINARKIPRFWDIKCTTVFGG